MNGFSLQEHPHRRYNPLTGEWVLVSPHRDKRPWQGQVEKEPVRTNPSYDPGCYLCPGNQRAGGAVNPAYTETFVFDNDFGALQTNNPEGAFEGDGLLVARSEQGICRVVCFSPDHGTTIPEMDNKAIRKVVDIWQKEYLNMGKREYIHYVQIFENKGSLMGCSNPHPHGQIWAQTNIPVEPAKESVKQLEYFQKNKRSLLRNYLDKELSIRQRVLFENEHFAALVPFWAMWPFETMIISKRHFQHIGQMTAKEKDDFAGAYKQLTIIYDNLFETSFPYSAGIHQSPTDGQEHPEWHFHMHFYPPLLRSATVKKFMVGYELLGNAQRDITPESSAAKLNALPVIHYKKMNNIN